MKIAVASEAGVSIWRTGRWSWVLVRRRLLSVS